MILKLKENIKKEWDYDVIYNLVYLLDGRGGRNIGWKFSVGEFYAFNIYVNKINDEVTLETEEDFNECSIQEFLEAKEFVEEQLEFLDYEKIKKAIAKDYKKYNLSEVFDLESVVLEGNKKKMIYDVKKNMMLKFKKNIKKEWPYDIVKKIIVLLDKRGGKTIGYDDTIAWEFSKWEIQDLNLYINKNNDEMEFSYEQVFWQHKFDRNLLEKITNEEKKIRITEKYRVLTLLDILEPFV